MNAVFAAGRNEGERTLRRRNRVKRTVARRYNQNTSGLVSTLTPGDPMGPQPLGTPFSSIFRRATKDGATGGRWLSREVRKNTIYNYTYSTIFPPEIPIRFHKYSKKIFLLLTY